MSEQTFRAFLGAADTFRLIRMAEIHMEYAVGAPYYVEKHTRLAVAAEALADQVMSALTGDNSHVEEVCLLTLDADQQQVFGEARELRKYGQIFIR